MLLAAHQSVLKNMADYKAKWPQSVRKQSSPDAKWNVLSTSSARLLQDAVLGVWFQMGGML